jgi:hypothetical protein
MCPWTPGSTARSRSSRSHIRMRSTCLASSIPTLTTWPSYAAAIKARIRSCTFRTSAVCRQRPSARPAPKMTFRPPPPRFTSATSIAWWSVAAAASGVPCRTGRRSSRAVGRVLRLACRRAAGQHLWPVEVGNCGVVVAPLGKRPRRAGPSASRPQPPPRAARAAHTPASRARRGRRPGRGIARHRRSGRWTGRGRTAHPDGVSAREDGQRPPDQRCQNARGYSAAVHQTALASPVPRHRRGVPVVPLRRRLPYRAPLAAGAGSRPGGYANMGWGSAALFPSGPPCCGRGTPSLRPDAWRNASARAYWDLPSRPRARAISSPTVSSLSRQSAM